MSDHLIGRAVSATTTRVPSDLYRAVWRWHFYAGLLVLPFLVSLAVTGGLYLFHDEIDSLVHADLKRVEVPADGAKALPSAIINAALAVQPGKAVKLTTPATPDASAIVTIVAASGEKLAVYVDPYTGKVLGSLPNEGTIMWTIRRLHSLKIFNENARMLIELAAGWSILLVGTGVYLWWPRGKSGGVVTLRGKPRQRMFWRDLHAVTGIFVGGVIVFLAVTGMPWSSVWGAKVNEWANSGNFGYPAGMWVGTPVSEEHVNHVTETSWSMAQAQLPKTSGHHMAEPVGIDTAVATFDRMGLHAGYAVSIPGDATGVYTGSVTPALLSAQRVIHLDQYTGKLLIDVGYTDFGPLATALEWGINVHMGQEFGLANQLALLAACVAIVVLAVAAGVMWWKRRPSGSLGVPPMPTDMRVFRGLIAILALGGIIFPLVGVSLVAMLLLDWLFLRAKAAMS